MNFPALPALLLHGMIFVAIGGGLLWLARRQSAARFSAAGRVLMAGVLILALVESFYPRP